jgi:hypothetical protein
MLLATVFPLLPLVRREVCAVCWSARTIHVVVACLTSLLYRHTSTVVNVKVRTKPLRDATESNFSFIWGSAALVADAATGILHCLDFVGFSGQKLRQAFCIVLRFVEHERLATTVSTFVQVPSPQSARQSWRIRCLAAPTWLNRPLARIKST